MKFKESTPRQKIWSLKEKIERLDARFHITQFPPCLCNFCQHFWSDHSYYDNYDCDWGCNVRVNEDDNEKIGVEMFHCAKFKPDTNVSAQIDHVLMNIQMDIIEKIAPFGKSIETLQKNIDEKTKLIDDANRELENIKKNYNFNYEEHLEKMKKFAPIEAIAKLTGLITEQVKPRPIINQEPSFFTKKYKETIASLKEINNDR